MKYSHTTIHDQLTLSCDTGSGVVFFEAQPGNTYYEDLLDRLNGNETCFTNDVPASIQQHADEKKHATQRAEYIQAKARLDKHKLIDGAPQVKLTVQTQLSGGDAGETYEYVASAPIDPVDEFIEETFTIVLSSQTPALSSRSIRNPKVIQDELERSEAQQIIDNTPDAIKQLDSTQS
jgi:hypothetical protein